MCCFLVQDISGPMTKNVRLAARLLSAMCVDTDYEGQLDENCLTKARIGVLRFHCGQFGQEVDDCFEVALKKMKDAGATIVEIPEEAKPDFDNIEDLEYKLLLREFKSDLNHYLKSRDPKTVPSLSLKDLIKFNLDHADEEMKHMGQDIFEQADATLGRDDPAYPAIKDEAKRLTGTECIDKLLKDFDCQVLVAPTNGPAFRIDLEGGDGVHGLNTLTTRRTTLLPAVSGYPHLTIPMGKVQRVKPVGMSFIGAAKSEATLLSFGYAFEQLMS